MKSKNVTFLQNATVKLFDMRCVLYTVWDVPYKKLTVRFFYLLEMRNLSASEVE